MRILRVHAGAFSCFAFSPTLPYLISGHENAIIRVWDLANFLPIIDLSIPCRSSFARICFHPDGRHFFINRRRPHSDILLFALEPTEAGSVTVRCVSENGDSTQSTFRCAERLGVVTHDGSRLLALDDLFGMLQVVPVRMFPIVAGTLALGTLFADIAISPDGNYLAILQRPNRISIRSIPQDPSATDVPSLAAFYHETNLHRVAFTPDGSRLVTLTRFSIQFWDWRNGALIKTIRASRRELHALAIDPAGRFAAVGGNEGHVAFWDLASGGQLGAYELDVGSIHCMAFSTDGLMIAAGGTTRRIALWDVALD